MNDTAESPVALRPVQARDCELVWRINNDQAVRSAAIHTHSISLETHRRWFAARLSDPHSLMFVVEAEREPVGVARFDCDAELGWEVGATISIAIAPPWRGRGIGSRAIALSTAAAGRAKGARIVIALIRPDNEPSLRAFASASYHAAGRTTVDGVELLRYRWSAEPSAAVLLLCDGSDAIGWGHAVRSAALAAAFGELGVETRLLIRGADSSLLRHLDAAATTVEAGPEVGDLDATVAAVKSAAARLLVVDSYLVDRVFLDAVHEATNVPRAVIDDLGDRDLRCEALLNPNPWAEEPETDRYGARTALLGTAYALLRPDFVPGRRPRRSVDAANPRVLVTLGGGELAVRAVELARAIDGLERPLRLDLLIGSGAGADAARELARAARHEVRVHVGRPDVASLMARATLAVSAAGTTCFELAACGVPALLIVAADNQRRGAPVWSRSGVFESLGELDEVSAREVAERVAALLDDPGRLAAMSVRGPKLVPGDGARRAARALLDLFESAEP